MSGKGVLAALATWLAAAIVIGAAGVLEPLPRPVLQVTILVLTVTVVALWRLAPGVRSPVERADIRLLLSVHLLRFVGIYFLVLYSQGRLPWSFAVPGGIGDTIAAAGALAIIASPAARRARQLLLIWNVFGAIDIVSVVVAAARAGLADPASMRELTVLPLALLPTFAVPLIIASHIMLTARLLAPGFHAERAVTRTAE